MEIVIFGLLEYENKILVIKEGEKIQIPNTKKHKDKTINESIENIFKKIGIDAKVSDIIDAIQFMSSKGPKVFIFVELKAEEEFPHQKFLWINKKEIAKIYGRVSKKLTNFLSEHHH